MKRINLSEGMRFGMGADSHTEEARGEAITFNGIEHEAGGQVVASALKMIQSQDSLMESMNISVSASVRYGLASGDARFDFAKKHAVNTYSTYLLLKATVQNPPEHMVAPKLTDTAAQLYQRSPEEFRQTFGDVFIDEIYSGGEFFGLFTFESQDESTKTEISAKLDVSVGSVLAGGSVSVAFSNTIEEVSRKSRMFIDVFMSGGIGLHNPRNLEELMTLYTNFNESTATHGTAYQASVKDFQYLPLPPGPTWAEQVVRRETVAACGRYVVDALKIRGQIEYILGHKKEFEAFDEAALRTQLQVLDSRFPLWAQRAKDCVQDVAQCSLAGVEPISLSLPTRLQSTDPLDWKWQDTLTYDSRAAAYFQPQFLGGSSITQYDRDDRRVGRFKLFHRDGTGPEIGGIFWHPDLGAHVVYGPIFQEYMNRGLCNGPLGYPTSDDETLASRDGGRGLERVSFFEHGFLWWDAQTGAVADHLRPMQERPYEELPHPGPTAIGRFARGGS